VDPDVKRIYTLNYNLASSNELLPRVSVSANWFHVDYYNLKSATTVLQTFSDYTPQQVISPLDGSAITIYNVSRAKLNRSVLGHQRAEPEALVHGFEFGFNARLGRGATLFGGHRPTRRSSRRADETSNPNNLLIAIRPRVEFLADAVQAGRTYPLPGIISRSRAYTQFFLSRKNRPLRILMTGTNQPPSLIYIVHILLRSPTVYLTFSSHSFPRSAAVTSRSMSHRRQLSPTRSRALNPNSKPLYQSFRFGAFWCPKYIIFLIL